MIRIYKDLENIPKSLVKGSTLSKRTGVIVKKEYPSSNSTSSKNQKKKVKDYDLRFKQSDIKKQLSELYHNKCAYCEQEIIAGTEIVENKSTIEHYRPKSKYYWLAYSWDNLLWCCHRCNQNKSNSFEINKIQVPYKDSFKLSIHTSTSNYQKIEEPKMIHPEFESVINKLRFEDGIIDSNDVRIKYTINTCKLDRYDLNEKRKNIVDVFVKKVKARTVSEDSFQDILNELLDDFKNDKKEFRALRYWILKNYKSLVELR